MTPDQQVFHRSVETLISRMVVEELVNLSNRLTLMEKHLAAISKKLVQTEAVP